MTRSAVTLLFQSNAIGALLVIARQRFLGAVAELPERYVHRVALLLDQHRFEAALKHRPVGAVRPIELDGVTHIEPANRVAQVRRAGPHQIDSKLLKVRLKADFTKLAENIEGPIRPTVGCLGGITPEQNCFGEILPSFIKTLFLG